MADKQVSIRLSPQLHAEVREAAIGEYGVKGISQWVREAAQQMLESPEYFRLIGIGDSLDVPRTDTMIVRLPAVVLSSVRSAVLALRMESPTLVGPQSLVLRSALRYRLRNPQIFGEKGRAVSESG